MVLFITALIVSMIFFVASIVLAFKTYQRKKRNKKITSINEYKRKIENRSMLISVLGLIFSVFSMIYTLFNVVPVPTIYPLDNEARVYNGTAKVTIDTYPLLTTYYSLDGSDPEKGNIYEDTITITKTTTVSAKNKFLIFWSGLSQNTYRFESVQNIIVNNTDDADDKTMSAKDFFTYIIIILIFGIILVLAIRGELDKD